MRGVKRFEELEVWQKAREMAREIYACGGEGGFVRDFGLRDQIRRAAVSVVSNIAEGFERGGDREFRHFLAQAKGSCGEVRVNSTSLPIRDILPRSSLIASVTGHCRSAAC